MRKRLLKEDGFTLVETMVTIMVMITVLFALYSIFDMGIRVFSFGNNKIEATENARLGLEKMAREIKAAYPYDKGNPTSPDTHLFDTMSSTQITFANDVGAGDRVIDPTTERITYNLSGTTLQRRVGSGTPQPVVEHLKTDDPSTPADETGLKFEYLKSSGANFVPVTPLDATTESQIQVVRITLTIETGSGAANSATQTLSTDVALRNRG